MVFISWLPAFNLDLLDFFQSCPGFVSDFIFPSKGRAEEKFKTEEDIRRLDAQANREPNLGILEHERKRKLEVRDFFFNFETFNLV